MGRNSSITSIFLDWLAWTSAWQMRLPFSCVYEDFWKILWIPYEIQYTYFILELLTHYADRNLLVFSSESSFCLDSWCFSWVSFWGMSIDEVSFQEWCEGFLFYQAQHHNPDCRRTIEHQAWSLLIYLFFLRWGHLQGCFSDLQRKGIKPLVIAFLYFNWWFRWDWLKTWFRRWCAWKMFQYVKNIILVEGWFDWALPLGEGWEHSWVMKIFPKQFSCVHKIRDKFRSSEHSEIPPTMWGYLIWILIELHTHWEFYQQFSHFFRCFWCYEFYDFLPSSMCHTDTGTSSWGKYGIYSHWYAKCKTDEAQRNLFPECDGLIECFSRWLDCIQVRYAWGYKGMVFHASVNFIIGLYFKIYRI